MIKDIVFIDMNGELLEEGNFGEYWNLLVSVGYILWEK